MQYATHPVTNPIHATITVPGAKEITLRALLLAALADGVADITNVDTSEDTRALISALYQLGIAIQLDEKLNSCIVAGGNGKFPKKQATIWCRDNKSIAEFLLMACSGSPGSYYFDGLPILREQSLESLLTFLTRHGLQFTPSDAHQLPLTLTGMDSIEGGEIMLDASMSNEFISALLIIAPFARSAFQFMLPDSANHATIDMTCAMMGEFGVLVQRRHQNQFIIPVPQRYQAKDYTIEPNFTLAAYLFAAAVITNGEISIQPTKRAQAKHVDSHFLTILEEMGCKVLETHTGLKVKGNIDLQGVEVSMHDCINTFPALAAIAVFAKSPTRIINITSLERILALKQEFIKLNIHVEMGENWLHIYPSQPQAATVDSHQDPHLAMALAIIGLKTPGIIVEKAECINDAYPDFFNLWSQLTRVINVSA